LTKRGLKPINSSGHLGAVGGKTSLHLAQLFTSARQANGI